jgi:hypothetical protein
MFFPSNAARVVVQFEETFPSSYGTAEAVPFQNEFKLSHYPELRRVVGGERDAASRVSTAELLALDFY